MTRTIENPDSERYVIIAGGDGYATLTVTGRSNMELAFFKAHWPEVKTDATGVLELLSDEQRSTLDFVRDEDEWALHHDLGRVHLSCRYEADWVEVYRLTDDLVQGC